MRLSFRQKLWLPLILSMVLIFILSILDAYRIREIRYEERKTDLVHATQLAVAIVKSFADEAAAGKISMDQAKERALAAVAAMRYGQGGTGYFTLLNFEPVILMHPFHREMQGKNVNGYKDPNGVALYHDTVAAVQRDGGGFVSYSFTKPGATGLFPKVAYAAAYGPWNWILQTGAYLDDIDAAFRASLYLSLTVLLVAAAALAGVVIWINRGILRLLGGDPAYAVHIASCIAENDMSVVVETTRNDDRSLLHSMKRMQQQLSATIRTIHESSESIVSAVSEIATGNQDLSQRTEEQAASLQETASSMEELTSTVTHNANNARQASHVATAAMETAQRGGGVVQKVIETMSGINTSSEHIADIVGTIESIAFQTNILALNAAVEAARAGEQGRGFAVVASEVRSLAQRTTAASKEIKDLIQDSVQRVKTGAEFVGAAGTTMQEIVQSVQHVTDIVNEIAVAATEQSKGISQVSEAVSQMDTVTQQNAALVEQVAAAAFSVKTQAEDLRSTVAQFKLT
ncbi:MAG: methyl-accepting chemotaxis protein [Paraburkholderia sp.]|jgi:methyl-accepting chemotaxis protein|uniref:methyl-accepting chemotaxis protein n=1 Tax=Burkholderiaceae TaxID=119060 RepID=UPI0010F7F473|nr:methyl-accepting chemotaxis protein [Burkholderia sp. 4M9327F10]